MTAVRLGRVFAEGREQPVAEINGAVAAIEPRALPNPSTRTRLTAQTVGEALRGGDVRVLAPGSFEWLTPVKPSKLICVGTNYHDHIAEMQGPATISATPPPWPFGYLRPASALVGSGQIVRLPSYAEKVDWQAELAIVIGDATGAHGTDPLEAVCGYTIMNGLSVRDFLPFPHALGLDAIVAKGFDGAAPMGAWLTPAELVGDPNALSIELRVNGRVKQRSSTAQMIFGVGAIVRHFAQIMTLEPGDVIATGTPAGVGAGRVPPEYLKAGDLVEIEIERLGRLATPIAMASEPLSPLLHREQSYE